MTIKTQSVADGVWHLEDERGGVMYLVTGNERALLIDTGWGTDDLATHIANLTSLPLWVVNTHGHRDHIGGNAQFEEVYIHTNDIPLIQDPATKLVPIYDGYVFDLGQRKVRVIGVPGHSPGSICLLDKQTRTLFTGDSPRPGALWLHLPTSLPLQVFLSGLMHLRTFADEFDTLAPSHGKPHPAGSLLDDLIEGIGKILDEEIVGQPHQSRFGECMLAEFDETGVMYREDDIHWRARARQERLISPEVHPDRTVTFRVKAPNAQRVLLNSTPIMNTLGSADSDMAFSEQDEDGVWSLKVGPLPPDIYDYSFVIDGTSFADSQNFDVQTGYMPPRSLVIVPPDEGTSYHAARDVPHGTLHCHYYTSKTIGDVRDVYVYTPPEYDVDQDRAYPVLYLLHGMGEVAAGWSAMGRVHLMMDNLLAEGKAKPMIIVMPFGHAVPHTATMEERFFKNTTLVEQDLFTDVIPLVENTYRVQADREHRALAGLSMGAWQTDVIGLGNLDTFSYIGLFSVGAYQFEERHADLLADPAKTNARLNLLFLGCGTLDRLAYEDQKHLHALLEKTGIEHVYWTLEGAAHTWLVWRSVLYEEFLPRLWKT